jgi:diguanylate cyclase (GGDEF)-like protein
MVGSRLATVGGGGAAFRYGGEEFAVVFPGTSLAEALPFLESLRRTIEASVFTVRSRFRRPGKPKKRRASRGRKKVAVTVSIGVAEPTPDRPGPAEVLRAADAALYRAKNAGRNRLAT